MEKTKIDHIIESELHELHVNERLLECLQLRIYLGREHYALKSDNQKNEYDIMVIQTQAKIDSLILKISEKRHMAMETVEEYLRQIEFFEKNKSNE